MPAPRARARASPREARETNQRVRESRVALGAVAGTRGGRRITTRARVRAKAARARARLPATTTGTTTAAMAATVPAPRARARGQRARGRARVRATTTIEALAAGSSEHSLNLAVQHAVADSFVSRAASAPHRPYRADHCAGRRLFAYFDSASPRRQ